MKIHFKSLLPAMILAGIVVVILTNLRQVGDRSTVAGDQADQSAVIPVDGSLGAPAREPIQRSANVNLPPPSIAARVDALVADRNTMTSGLAARNKRIRLELANQYMREKPDPAWAADKERALTEIAERADVASDSMTGRLSTDCKRSVCRTTASFASRSEAEEWVSLYMASMGSVTRRSLVSIRDDAEGVIVEVYSSGS